MADVLQVKVPFDGKPEKEIPVTAYAFDKQGKLLATAPVASGQAKLGLSAQQAATARIIVAPARPEGAGKEPPSLQSLQRLHAYEPTFKIDPKSAIQQIGPIPEAIWKLWLFCKCHVRGHVVRPVTVGGQSRDLPICRARVHICEVDAIPRIILRLPDPTIFKLRDELVAAVENPIHPIPIPLPARMSPTCRISSFRSCRSATT